MCAFEWLNLEFGDAVQCGLVLAREPFTSDFGHNYNASALRKGAECCRPMISLVYCLKLDCHLLNFPRGLFSHWKRFGYRFIILSIFK